MGPNGHLLDIVFISSDEDVESWKEYSSKMPWYGLHFNDKKTVKSFGFSSLMLVRHEELGSIASYMYILL